MSEYAIFVVILNAVWPLVFYAMSLPAYFSSQLNYGAENENKVAQSG